MDGEWERLSAAVGDREAPFALVDLDAFDANAFDLVRRAAGKPIRLATKSVRCRALASRALAVDGFRGQMTFTLAESRWLAEQDGGEDRLLAYPTADRAGLRAMDRDDAILMVDSTEGLDLIAAARAGAPTRICLEVDLSWRPLGERPRAPHVGVRRSPVRSAAQAARLARDVARRPGLELVGVMGYEAHVAGLGDAPPSRARAALIQAMQRRSRAELAERRAAVVGAVQAEADRPLLVNGGGTGSLESSAAEPAVTEVTAGSGLYVPGLFDHYAAFTPRPAAFFALPVVRRPSRGRVTLLGGGYLASGPVDALRLPTVHAPAGLRLEPLEGAGEVQTPVRGAAADVLRLGDRVFLRHAKAGELCERFATLLLVRRGEVVDEVPTYRGEGRTLL